LTTQVGSSRPLLTVTGLSYADIENSLRLNSDNPQSFLNLAKGFFRLPLNLFWFSP
jgi:hypothetical protein